MVKSKFFNCDQTNAEAKMKEWQEQNPRKNRQCCSLMTTLWRSCPQSMMLQMTKLNMYHKSRDASVPTRRNTKWS